MTIKPETAIPGAAEPAPKVDRRRGPRGPRVDHPDGYERRNPAYSPRNIIKAASAAGYGSLTIDRDGKITLQKGAPADSAGGDNGESTLWDKLLDEK